MKTSRARKLGWLGSLVAVFTLGIVCSGLRLRWLSRQGGILPPWTANGLFHQCSRHVPGNIQGYWLPYPGQVEVLERRLPAFLESKPQAQLHLDLSTYYLQYAGFVANGRYLIYANAVRNDWSSGAFSPAYLCDGGPEASFGVVFDPQTQQFSQFMPNGPMPWP